MWLRVILCTVVLLQVSEGLINPCKKGLKSTQFFPHPESDAKYIQCSMFGQMFVFSCPPGLVWKQANTACDRKNFISIFSIPPSTTHAPSVDTGSAPSARIVAPMASSVVPPAVPQVPSMSVPIQQQQPQVQQPQQMVQQQQQQQPQSQLPQQVQQQQIQQMEQQLLQQQQPQSQLPQQVQQQQVQAQQQQIQQMEQQLAQQQQQQQQQQQHQQQQQQQQQLQVQDSTRVNFQRTNEPEFGQPEQTSTQFVPIVATNPTISSNVSPTTVTTPTPVPIPVDQPAVPAVGVATVQQPQSVSPPAAAEMGSPASSGHCDTMTVSGSVFNIVNGLYSKLAASPSIYRRSDNLQLPGLIVKTSEHQWCVTFSFSTVDFSTLTVPEVLKRCGAGLECCMLISEPTTPGLVSAEIDDPSAAWIVNILDNKGKQDAGIKVNCETTVVKACTKVPFCPPECQGTRDGCDICECNGVPFFKIQSSELSSLGQQQLQQQQQQTPQQQQVQQPAQPQVPQQVQQQAQIPQQSQIQSQVQPQTPQQQPAQPQMTQQVPQQPQVQPQPSTLPNPTIMPSTVVIPPSTPVQQVVPPQKQPQQQPVQPVTKLVSPASPKPSSIAPQIIQEEQFRPTFIEHPHQEQQNQVQLQQQELQTLNELGKAVHNAQAQNLETQSMAVNKFASHVQAIEKQQLQNQVDQLNRLIASAKTPSVAPVTQPPVTRPMFPGQKPADVKTQPAGQKIVQTFPHVEQPTATVDKNHFVNNIPVGQPQPLPTQQSQQQRVAVDGITERQRHELELQQRRQQELIARQHQEQLMKQEQEQRFLQQQFKQLQQQKALGIATLSSKKFASRLPQPIAQMNHVRTLAMDTKNQTQQVHFPSSEVQAQKPSNPQMHTPLFTFNPINTVPPTQHQFNPNQQFVPKPIESSSQQNQSSSQQMTLPSKTSQPTLQQASLPSQQSQLPSHNSNQPTTFQQIPLQPQQITLPSHKSNQPSFQQVPLPSQQKSQQNQLPSVSNQPTFHQIPLQPQQISSTSQHNQLPSKSNQPTMQGTFPSQQNQLPSRSNQPSIDGQPKPLEKTQDHQVNSGIPFGIPQTIRPFNPSIEFNRKFQATISKNNQ